MWNISYRLSPGGIQHQIPPETLSEHLLQNVKMRCIKDYLSKWCDFYYIPQNIGSGYFFDSECIRNPGAMEMNSFLWRQIPAFIVYTHMTRLSCIFLMCCLSYLSTAQNILINDQGFPNEPSIMMDPLNPNVIIGAANINQYYIGLDTCLLYTSDAADE